MNRLGALCMLFMLASPASGQSLALVAGEVRHGQHGRQDFGGVELAFRTGPVHGYMEAAGRHGDNDDSNSGLPWLTATVGPAFTLGPVDVGVGAGVYAAPMDYGQWHPLAGPRVDVHVGGPWTLHLSHYWRRGGWVGMRWAEWTPRTAFRIGYSILGG